MYNKVFKCPADILISLILLILLSPFFAALAIAVRIKLGSPVLFRQKRPGYREKIFEIIKFRTMTDARDEKGELLPDKQRITKFGKFLRASSLDELPELISILKGEMSFVGPRPLSVLYLPFYTPEEARRHDVRPGLTGLAQVNGRNALNWDERLRLDVYYVDHMSPTLDLKILLQTVKKVLFKEDVITAGTGKVGDLDEVRPVQRPEYLKRKE